MSESFDNELYNKGLSDARNGRAPAGFNLDHTDASYIAGVINGTEFGKRTVADGLRWHPEDLGSHMAGIATALGLPCPVRAIGYAAEQVLEKREATEASELAREILQDAQDE